MSVPLSLFLYLSHAARAKTEGTSGESGGLAKTKWYEGGIEVEVLDANVPEGESLYIFISVKTSDPRKKVTYSGWRQSSSVKMVDDAGNRYSQKRYDIVADGLIAAEWNSRPSSRNLKYGSGSVTSEQGRIEILVFSPPPPGIEYLDLDLPARVIGESGTIRLRIPATMWRVPEPERREPARKGKR